MLVGHAHRHGYQATCTRDRGHLGMPDDLLLEIAVAEEHVFVTNNHADFAGLCANADLHTGLIVLPQRPREQQPQLLPEAGDDRVEPRERSSFWLLATGGAKVLSDCRFPTRI